MKFVGGVGYTNIDLIYSDMERLPGLGEEVYAGGFGVHLGGGCPATLINTTRLGVPSRILTFVGPGHFCFVLVDICWLKTQHSEN